METSTHDKDHQKRLPSLRVATAQSSDSESQLREELLSVLLHDLRSPLGAIAVLGDLIASLNEQGDCADSHQLRLLNEAVVRAQQLLDDALEIQSVIRGSTVFNPTIVDLAGLIHSSVEQARHAPYYQSADISVQLENCSHDVRTDLERIEAVLLCVLEHMIVQAGPGGDLIIRTKNSDDNIKVIIESRHTATAGNARPFISYGRHGLRGRLGMRRAGESRFSLSICDKVLDQLGGHMILTQNDYPTLELTLPHEKSETSDARNSA